MLFDFALQKQTNVCREQRWMERNVRKKHDLSQHLYYFVSSVDGSTEQRQFCVGTEGENGRTARKILTNFLLDFLLYPSLAT